MKNKVVMVTGATNGIGKMAALEIARMGSKVILVGRNQDKLDQSMQELKTQTNNPEITTIQADLSSLKDVHEAADSFLTRYDRLDVLLNNAGALFTRRQESLDGYEMTFALNHLNYFLLTNLLLGALKKTASEQGEARIVNVSSGLHRKASIDFDDLQHQKSFFGISVYSQTKLMNVLFTYELANRLARTNVTANVLEPVVKTGFGRNNGISSLVIMLIQWRSKSAAEGAQTSVYLASSPDVKGITGKYWVDEQENPSSEVSHDEEMQQRLWEISEEMVGL